MGSAIIWPHKAVPCAEILQGTKQAPVPVVMREREVVQLPSRYGQTVVMYSFSNRAYMS